MENTIIPPVLVQFIHTTYPNEDQQQEIRDFIHSLNELEIQALLIAFDHLGSSFDILRSNGYQKWCKRKP